ncbi:hypothetical protein H4R27_006370 [Coemansia aciculifera]|uniref:Mitochondrial cytochrome c oxidase assembly factor n=1 Tax=Coemansia pectinata TaxID=1052879 RepID=A0A9W8GSE4_9FUNG|nr:hypothetical protein GGI19_006416 [Coemansia pectinata]KAJ2876028.1 hypothetical protein H4R27_006370 [Coemansia aciculifera]
MGGPGLEVAKFTFYVFMPMAFMVYFGGPGFYERYVADEAFKFSPPPLKPLPTEPSDIKRALDQLKEARLQRKLMRERVMKEMAEEDRVSAVAGGSR